ncbi:protein FAM98B-like [Uloborus diversus]|uniref:protein FAM98B-like n=1 Tax=Uloborus diversus TaxID=327109 RepID=UPI00240A60EF|nr:protein FAM98B-like [Uloborus diversus]
MEFDVLDSLDDLGYTENFATDDAVRQALKEGTKSLDFINLISWFSTELQALCHLDSCINPITDLEDVSSFLLEVSSFLKELHCPYKSLVSGTISQRLLDIQSRTTLLDFLCTELQAARLLHSKKDQKNPLEIELEGSSTAIALSSSANILNINTDNVADPLSLFSSMETKVKSLTSENGRILPPVLIQEVLTEQQWESLAALYDEFLSDYNVRRELLLTRLDVTIQSFKWGEGSQGKDKEIFQAYMPRRKKLLNISNVQLSDVIAAREDVLIIEKTSSAELVKNTTSSLNRILIPHVPDRGGRPKEQRPPVEMPNWMKRQQGGSGRGDHHGGGWQGKKFRGGYKGGGKQQR